MFMKHISLYQKVKASSFKAMGLKAVWLSLAIVFGAGQAVAGSFLGEVDDLPLMPGLTPLQNTGVNFDSPQGRIVEVYTAGKVTRPEVISFYAESLPQLGWVVQDVGDAGAAWRRENEVLRLMFSGTGPIVTVHFSLAPEGAKGATVVPPAATAKPPAAVAPKAPAGKPAAAPVKKTQ